MYSDLLDVLGGQDGNASGTTRQNRNGGDDGQKHVALRVKAGKMDMELLDNGNYHVSPDNRRGQIQLVWDRSSSTLQWEWYDRRAKTVVDSYTIGASDAESTFERVSTGTDKDRVFLWQRPQVMSEDHPQFTMYWMQDLPLEEGKDDGDDDNDNEDDEERMDDDTIVVKLNQFLTNPSDANPDAASSTTETAPTTNDNPHATADATNSSTEALLQVMQGGGTTATGTATDRTAAAPTGSQVDALSNILENLGMPPQPTTSSETSASAPLDTTATTTGTTDNAAGSTTAADASTSATAGGTGTLTLADLQGAMAGLATSTPPATPGTASQGPPLSELVNTPGLIQSLLENEEVVQRLLPLLPEGQRTKQYLEENLASPQMSQTLRSLTSALLPDEQGSLEGYHSVICNFQLDPRDGQDALTHQANPIQAFLDCLVKQVEREQKDPQVDPSSQKEKEDDAMEES
mmetsp:Transcript_756/g.894  ORF Transcript_756/g.894 Transcript_756/m.894 type:complete len:462 (+) Transcript_756:33-1418(+)